MGYLKVKQDSIFYPLNTIRNIHTLTKSQIDKASECGSVISGIDDDNKDQYFFIVEQGKIEMTIDDKIYLLEKEDVISTKALIKNTQYFCMLQAKSRRAFVFKLPLGLYTKIFQRFITKSQEDKVSLLKKIYLFSNLEREVLSSISDECSRETITKQKVIIKEDKTPKSIFYIIKGKVSCIKGEQTIRAYGKDKIIGELSLFKPTPSPFSYVAEKDTQYLKIKYDHIKTALNNNENYSKILRKNVFFRAIKESRILRKYFQNDQHLTLLYKIFRSKYYKKQELIASSKNKKLFVPLGGIVYKKVSPLIYENDLELIQTLEIEKFYINGELGGEDLLRDLTCTNIFIGEEDVYGKTVTTVWSGDCLVLEASWTDILKTIQDNTPYATNNINAVNNSTINALSFQLPRTPQSQQNLPNLSGFLLTMSYNNITMYDKITYLKKVSYMKDLSEITYFALAENLKNIMFREGELILQNGPVSNKLYILTQGEVSLIIKDVEVKVIKPFEVFGDISQQHNHYKHLSSYYAKTLCVGYYLEKEVYEEITDMKSIRSTMKVIYKKDKVMMSIENLYYLREIGRGSYGKVYLVHNKNQFFALKSVNITLVTDIEASKYYKDEKKILSNLDHPFIVQLLNTFKTQQYIFFLMEHIEGQTLKKCLEFPQFFRTERNVPKITFIAAILCSVLGYLQRKRIIHRDLKPANLIVNTKGYIKVIDFGVAKNLIDKDSTRTFIGTIHYMAPEMLTGKDYSFSIDIWAIGVIIYEAFYGTLPFGIDLKDPNDVLTDICERRVILPYVPNNGHINEAIKNLLRKNSSKRFNMFNKWKEWEMFNGFNYHSLLHMQMPSPLLENGAVDLFQIGREPKTTNKQIQTGITSSCYEIQQPVTENDLYNDLCPFHNFIKNNMFATSHNIVDVDTMERNPCIDVFSDF